MPGTQRTAKHRRIRTQNRKPLEALSKFFPSIIFRQPFGTIVPAASQILTLMLHPLHRLVAYTSSLHRQAFDHSRPAAIGAIGMCKSQVEKNQAVSNIGRNYFTELRVKKQILILNNNKNPLKKGHNSRNDAKTSAMNCVETLQLGRR